jgi:DNA-binding NarL/FixJ family response regulator
MIIASNWNMDWGIFVNSNHIEIILVEDSQRVRESLKQMLSDIAGVVVSGEFKAAGEAIMGIDQLCPDLVIVDIRLQNSNGLDVLNHVRVAHPRTKTIVFSDRTGADYRTRVSQLGATHFFSKIGETEKLFGAVAAMATMATTSALATLAAGNC